MKKEPLMTLINADVFERRFLSSIRKSALSAVNPLHRDSLPLITRIARIISCLETIRNIRVIRGQTSSLKFLTADDAEDADYEMLQNHPQYPRNQRSNLFPHLP
jgi:hypothetical protein